MKSQKKKRTKYAKCRDLSKKDNKRPRANRVHCNKRTFPRSMGFLGTQVDIFETGDKQLLGSLSIKNVLMSEDKMEMTFETEKTKQSILPRQFIYIRLTKLNADACFLSVIHIAQEYVSPNVLMVISRFKKKVIGFVKEHFDKIYKERKNNKPQ